MRRFKKAIDAAARRAPVHLVFDLTAVTFMDSTALGVLAAEQRRRAEPLHLVVREPQLLRILRVTGYDQVFVIHASVEDALLDTGRRQARANGRPERLCRTARRRERPPGAREELPAAVPDHAPRSPSAAPSVSGLSTAKRTWWSTSADPCPC